MSSLPRSKTMKPPPKGWIKVNFDASYEDNGLAMVVKDEVGRLLLLSTHFLSCNSPHEAKVKALEKVLVHAVKCAWKNVLWNVGACELVKEVLDVSDLICWETRYDILSLRSFARPDWLLEWSGRETNVLADVAAKFSLVCGCNM